MVSDTTAGIPAAWVTAGLEAAIAHHKRQREAIWVCPSSGDAAAIIAGAMPFIVAAERERIGLPAVLRALNVAISEARHAQQQDELGKLEAALKALGGGTEPR